MTQRPLRETLLGKKGMVDATSPSGDVAGKKIQLALINPKLVICLGKEVGRVLPNIFKKLTEPGKSLLSLYADENNQDYIVHTNDKIYGARKFVLIPHPSYAHINWAQHDIKAKIKDAIKIKEKPAGNDQKIL